VTSLQAGGGRVAPAKGGDRLFRAVVDSVAAGVAVASLDARIVEANRALERMLGYATGELAGLGVRDIGHPDDVERDLELFADLATGRRDHCRVETRYRRSDGTSFWASVDSTLVRDGSGRPEYVVATIEDIDARKAAEVALQAAEERYRTLVEQLPLVTYIDATDAVSSNIYTSPQIEEVLGYTVEEWASDPELFVKLLHPDDRERVLREIAEAHASGGHFVSEYRLRARDGHVVWFRDESLPVRDASGIPLYDQGYLLDITSRRAADDALRESEERFRSMADDAPVMVWTADARGRATFLSRAWTDLTGRAPDAELGFGWLDALHPDDADTVLDSYLAAIREQGPWEAVFRLRRRDGEYRWIECRGRPRVLADGEFAGYVGIGTDTTEQKEAEGALARREAILEAVADLAEELLRASSWSQADLSALRSAAAVSRTYVFETVASRAGSTVVSQRSEWAGEGVVSLIEDPALEAFDLDANGFGDWAAALSAGRIVHAHVRDLSGVAREELARQGVRSFLVVPIVVGGEWWGFIGFDDCVDERVWSDGEIEALRVAAGVLGEAIRREGISRSLHEATETLEAVVSASPAGIIGFDAGGRVVIWSKAAEAIFGWTAAEAVGRFNPFAPPDLREEFLGNLERGLRGESWSSRELVRRRKDGAEITITAASAPLRNADGEIVGLTSVVTDVSEQKRTERLLEALVDGSPVAIVTSDPDGNVTGWNPAAEAMLGWTAAEVTGRPLPYAEDEPARLRVLAGETVFDAEGTRARNDGTVIDVRFSQAPLRSAGGDVVGAMTMLTDVTERRKAEVALEEVTNTLVSVIDSSPLAIVTFDRDGLVTSWNDAATATFGFTPEEVVGHPNPTLRLEDEAPFRRSLAAVLRGKSWRNAETKRRRADGRVIDVSISAGPLRGADGEVVGMVAMLADIGDRMRAEAALRESEERFRTLVANVPGVIYRCSPDADWTMRYMSDAIEELSGFPPSDFVDNAKRTYASVIHAEDREGVAAAVADALETGEPFSLLYRLVRADGAVCWVAEDGRPVYDEAGAPLWLDGVISDVTDQKRAEDAEQAAREALEVQNERLLELDRLKDEFVALVSHELRTPLTSILGYLELVLGGEVGDVNDEQQHFLAIVERNSQRLLRLVGDLLFVAQIEAGKLVLERDDVDLVALARECLEASRPRAAEKAIELTLLGEGPVGLQGDRTRLAQLLDNLVSNAIKFTGEGGRVAVGLASANGHRIVSVRDTGMGLSQDEVAHLFERFYRTEQATERAIPGTGLGLTITKAIVDAHRGSIAVESEEGKGTTFTVRLPVAGEPTGA